MSLSDLAVYLTLSPEFGGTRFGPFEQLEIRLGSDEERCQIVLPPSFGVLPEHVKVIRQGPQNIILAPAERTATTFLWRPESRKPEQVSTPVAVRPGDAFSLVTPSGPRFTVELDELPEEIEKARDEAAKRVGVGRRRLSADSMKAEGKRQIFTQLLVLGPMQILQRAVTFVKSGAIFQPRNIFLGVALLGGWVLGGAMSCRSKGLSGTIDRKTNEVDNCKAQLGVLKDGSEKVEDWTFPKLAGFIFGPAMEASLEADAPLAQAIEEQARQIHRSTGRNGPYEWFFAKGSQSRSEFQSWRDGVMKSEDFDEPTKKLVSWLAAVPRRNFGEFQRVVDSQEKDVCGRGFLRLSYRHAHHLGMEIQPDAYWNGVDEKEVEDIAYREAQLKQTMVDARRAPPEEPEWEVELEHLDSDKCMYATGSDDRAQRGALLGQLEDVLGKDANGVPDPEQSTHAQTMRIAAYWAAELPDHNLAEGQMRGAQFGGNQNTTSSVVSQMERGSEWVLKQTARTIATAMVLSCRAKLEGDPKTMAGIFGEDGLPQALPCLYLAYKLDQD